MHKQSQPGRLLITAGVLALLVGFFSSTAAAAGPAIATFTVTAVAKKGGEPPAVTKADAQLLVNKQHTPVADWQRGEKLYLAVLIDDSLDSVVANQWEDLRAFFNAQPDTTYIAVAYSRNGTAMLAQDFTNDHQLAAKALRIPLGPAAAAYSSPYLALQDLMKRWPTSNDRHSVLMISSGFDYFRGTFTPTSPDLDPAIEHAQKQNINVWSIYFPDALHRGRFFRSWTGQMNLTELAEQTGGECFFLSFEAPVTFKPFLDELATHLRNQYLLSFEGDGGPKGRLESVHVSTELSGVEFFSATRAFLPPAK
jgi:hypothetical protein